MAAIGVVTGAAGGGEDSAGTDDSAASKLALFAVSAAEQRLAQSGLELTNAGLASARTGGAVLTVEQVQRAVSHLGVVASTFGGESEATAARAEAVNAYVAALGLSMDHVPPVSTWTLHEVDAQAQLCQTVLDSVRVSEARGGVSGLGTGGSLCQRLLGDGVAVESVEAGSAGFEAAMDEIFGGPIDLVGADVVSLWKVERAEGRRRFDPSMPNKRLLFHGSRPQHWLGILTAGLQLPTVVVARHAAERWDAGKVRVIVFFLSRLMVCVCSCVFVWVRSCVFVCGYVCASLCVGTFVRVCCAAFPLPLPSLPNLTLNCLDPRRSLGPAFTLQTASRQPLPTPPPGLRLATRAWWASLAWRSGRCARPTRPTRPWWLPRVALTACAAGLGPRTDRPTLKTTSLWSTLRPSRCWSGWLRCDTTAAAAAAEADSTP